MAMYEVTVICTYDGTEEYINTHHYDFPFDELDNLDLQVLANRIDERYKTNLQGVLSSLCELGRINIRRVDVPDLPTGTYVAADGLWNGADTGNALKPDSAAMVTFTSNSPYPRTTRSYLFPMTEASNSSKGTVTQTAIDALAAWGAAILNIGTINGKLNDKSAVRYGSNPRVVVADNEVETFVVRTQWKNIKSRRFGRGS